MRTWYTDAMSATALGAIIAVAAAYAASVFAIIWYLGSRIDRLDDRLGARLDKLEAGVTEIHEDVTVLKATR